MTKVLVIGDLGSIHLAKWIDDLLDEYEIYVFTFSKRNVSKVLEQNVFVYNSHIPKKMWSFSAMSAIKRYEEKIQPDIIHAHYASSYGLLGAQLKCSRKVVSIWGSDINDTRKSYIRKILMKITLERYSVVNAASKDLYYKSRAISDKPDYQVFQYGIDTSKKKRDLSFLPEVENPIFIVNRGFSPLYRIDLIIKAFILFLDKGGKGQLKVFGYGSTDDTKRVKDTILRLNRNEIHFEGSVSQNALFDEMNNAHIYISIPTQDGAPLALYEAMYIGLFPIVSCVESNIESFTGGEACFFEGGDQFDLASLFMQASNDYNDRAALLKNRSIVESRYNYKTNINRMKSIYKKLTLDY